MMVAIKIPHNPVGDYINFYFSILPSKSGLVIYRTSIGKISIPNPIARYIIAYVIGLALGHNEGRYLLNSIDSVDLKHSSINVNMKQMPDLKQRLTMMRRHLRHVRDESGNHGYTRNSSSLLC